MFSFVGIECATIPGDGVQNPEKTIPRATMIGLFVTTLVHLLGSVSIMGIMPAKALQQSVTPYADAAVIMFGSNARYWASGGVAIAAFGCLHGWILVQGQIPFAVAGDKLFPAFFGWQNKKGAPYAGIIIGSIIVSLFMMMNYTKGLVAQFKFLILLATLSSLVPYLFCAAAYNYHPVRKKTPAHQGMAVCESYWYTCICLFVMGDCRSRAKQRLLGLYTAYGRHPFLCLGAL